MNFLDIYNHYVRVERVTEIEPGRTMTIGKTVLSPTEPHEKPSLYLHLTLLDGHIAYQGEQKSTVKMAEDGLLEGRYYVERHLRFSREAFTAVFVKTFPLWKDAYTFYMVCGDSKPFNKFRNLVVIREERLAPISLQLNTNFQEYYEKKIGITENPKSISIPLVSFSVPAFEFLIEEGILTIPENSGEEEIKIQNLIDTILSKFHRWYLG